MSAQGELFRAHAHIRPRRANFFAHEARQRGDVETNNTSAATGAGQHETAGTTARPQTATIETGITSAAEKCTKNAHFAPTKATTVSTPRTDERAKATGVSDNRPSWPTGPGCGARGRRRGLSTHKRQAPTDRRRPLRSRSAFLDALRLVLSTLREAGSRATNTPRQTMNPPTCRPIQPKPSFLGALHPMGLHVGRNNDQDRDLIATNRGNCTTRVSDTPTTCRQQASCSAKPPSNTNYTNQPGQLPHKQTVNNLCTPPDPNSEHPNRCTLHTRIGCADADRLSPRG